MLFLFKYQYRGYMILNYMHRCDFFGLKNPYLIKCPISSRSDLIKIILYKCKSIQPLFFKVYSIIFITLVQLCPICSIPRLHHSAGLEAKSPNTRFRRQPQNRRSCREGGEPSRGTGDGWMAAQVQGQHMLDEEEL